MGRECAKHPGGLTYRARCPCAVWRRRKHEFLALWAPAAGSPVPPEQLTGNRLARLLAGPSPTAAPLRGLPIRGDTDSTVSWTSRTRRKRRMVNAPLPPAAAGHKLDCFPDVLFSVASCVTLGCWPWGASGSLRQDRTNPRNRASSMIWASWRCGRLPVRRSAASEEGVIAVGRFDDHAPHPRTIQSGTRAAGAVGINPKTKRTQEIALFQRVDCSTMRTSVTSRIGRWYFRHSSCGSAGCAPRAHTLHAQARPRRQRTNATGRDAHATQCRRLDRPGPARDFRHVTDAPAFGAPPIRETRCSS